MEICALDLVWQSESTEDFAVRRAEYVGDDNFLPCHSILILEHLSSHLQFFIVCTSFPFTKMLNSVMLFKEFFEKLQCPCSLVKLCRVNFGCTQSPVKRQVSWDYKELYLRDDILLDAALKTDSETRAMSGMTDLLLNLQCSKCPRQTLANTRGFNVERVFCRATHWMCNVRKWA